MARRPKPTPVLIRRTITDREEAAKVLSKAIQDMPQIAGVPEVVVKRPDLEDVIAILIKPPRREPIPADVLAAWDDLNGACDAIVTAQPYQMSEAADRLERVRKVFRDVIFRAAIARPVDTV